jgi:hypothetical protein
MRLKHVKNKEQSPREAKINATSVGLQKLA